jgi:hypothetical protein
VNISAVFLLSQPREFATSNLYISGIEHFASDFICSQLHDSTLDLSSEDVIGRVSSKFYALARSKLDGILISVLSHILSHQLLSDFKRR